MPKHTCRQGRRGGRLKSGRSVGKTDADDGDALPTGGLSGDQCGLDVGRKDGGQAKEQAADSSLKYGSTFSASTRKSVEASRIRAGCGSHLQYGRASGIPHGCERPFRISWAWAGEQVRKARCPGGSCINGLSFCAAGLILSHLIN